MPDNLTVYEVNQKAEWLIPFISDAYKLVPNISKLRSFKIVQTRKTLLNPSHGMTYTDENERHFRISIYTHYRSVVSKKPCKLKWLPYETMDLMDTVAHELAHLTHWYHTPEHRVLTCKITILFMKRLKRMGFESTEINDTLRKPFYMGDMNG